LKFCANIEMITEHDWKEKIKAIHYAAGDYDADVSCVEDY